MGAISQLTRFFNRSRVFHTPSTVSGGAPYGGTELGAIREIKVFPGATGRPFFDPYKGAVIDVAEAYVEFPRIELLFRQWDDDMLAIMFPSTTGSSKLVANIGAATGGTSGVGRAVKLLLASVDTNGLFALIQTAIPAQMEERWIPFARRHEAALAATFYVGSASGAPLQVGKADEILINGA